MGRLLYPPHLVISFFPVVLLVTASYGEGFFRNEPDGVTFFPGWQRITRAASHAITDPFTWIPTVAAAGVYFTNSDKSLSDWATMRCPLFGSQEKAAVTSNLLLNGTIIAFFASGIARIGMTEPRWSLYPSAAGLFWGLSAHGLTGGCTELIKSGSGRARPNGNDRLSFPSGHASSAAVSSALACSNIEALPLGRPLRLTLESGVMLMGLATAWARVEAKRHYLSDVLAGVAIGNLIGIFINDAFIGTKPLLKVDIGISMSKKNRGAGFTISLPVQNKSLVGR